MAFQPVDNPHARLKTHYLRINLLNIAIIVLSLLLVCRLLYLQITQFNRYETLSLKNQMSIIPIAPPRGIIVDANGVVLAENIPVYVLEIIPEHVKNIPDTLKRLRQLIPSISEEDIHNFNRARYQNRSFIPIPLKLKLTEEEVAIFASYQYQFTGVSIKAQLMRYYPYGELTAHVLGYVGRINVQELQQVDPSNYRATNFIGKTGLERFYEDRLHGQVGYQQVETDVSGRTLRTIHKINPQSGEKLYLTLDIRLQKAAYEAMKNKRGAVVVLNPRNGNVLALVSSPSYEPNHFVNGIDAIHYKALATAIDKPLYNRAVRGAYPPASTLKPFIALTGLENGVADLNFKIQDPGWFKLPNSTHAYRDWKKTGHGVINMVRAITVSCDTYFYQLGHRLGINAIEDMLIQFGFGQLTHIDLIEEAPGLLPNPRWKRSAKGVSWYPGDTLITSIGQGFMLASPLQLANATAALGQHGRRFRPHLLDKIGKNDNERPQKYQPLEEYPIRLKEENYWTIISQAMHSVTTSDEGTGYRFGRNPPYPVAAKTGTAQVFGGKQYENKKQENMSEFLRDHSLFIAFSPVEDPEITLAVMVENDSAASIVARQVLDAYYRLKRGELS